MFKCIICGKECSSKGISSHLRTHSINSKEYYDKYMKKENEGKCKICGKDTSFDNIFVGYRSYCCSKCANLDPIIRAKIEQTSINKYGVKCNLNMKSIQDKAIKNSQSDEAKNKRSSTNIKRYGAENPYASKEIKEKIKQNNLKNYGVEYSWQRDDVKNKIKKTSIEKYGTNSPIQSEIVKAHAKKLRVNRLKCFSEQNNCTSREELIKKFGFGWLYVIENLNIQFIYCGNNAFIKNEDIYKIEEYSKINHYQSSLFEQEIIQYIHSIYHNTILTNVRKIISPYELDIYIPNKHIAIECNGTYWHNCDHKDKFYHFNKSKMCADLGIRLIHIYEWEWIKYPEKIKQLLNIALGSVNRIYARNCEVRQITNKEAKSFNEATHLQGHRNAQITYGLFYKDELVQLMSFSKTRYNRNLKSDTEWEIIRGCPGSNNIVVGGVSKLFKHFVSDYQPTKIFSYCDFNKFDGKSYIALGMNFIGYTGPNKWWIVDGIAIERNPKKYQELKNNNKLWGSGSMKFEWTNNIYS